MKERERWTKRGGEGVRESRKGEEERKREV